MTIFRLDLLRHGEPQGGARFRGDGVDDPLSDLGWQQMWSAMGGEDLPHALPWTQIISSPMQRCQSFARRLAECTGLPLAIESRFREVGFGAWEGRTRAELRAQGPEYQAFFADPVNARPAGSEPLEDFYARVIHGLGHIQQEYADQHVLLVTHAGVIRATICYALDIPLKAMYRIKIPYAGVTQVEADQMGLSLMYVNRLQGLAP
ncbi:probable phosphoglycerate mutase [Ectothiorhodosinus mongolicus]|uniref:Probable phosphoglycerate mutase n=1 Tax=Ectothiorhodosinus mongolicus TaxID=233100 RepID=A0A1R3W003_9GAMM|nr:alpha-ribazole phosphatase family protein [Ectothiorhodosinus mongolicus]ULX57251.1 histidine phosphatase family protein [Ectothiorhodosinus mongolicus]SIT70628.1 probable phosphoglycerate mutase [Ectothiorhodosinus mongolicus]